MFWYFNCFFSLYFEFLSDLVHIQEDLKADGGEEQRNKLEAKVGVVKEDKKKLEGRLVDMEHQAAEIAKTNSTLLVQVILLFYFLSSLVSCFDVFLL